MLILALSSRFAKPLARLRENAEKRGSVNRQAGRNPVVTGRPPNGPWNGDVIVDRDINPSGSTLSALWPAGAPGLPVSQRTDVTVAEPDGSTGTGPLSVVTVQLAPMQALVATSAPAAGF